jgi:hypothetical protein
LRNQMEGCNGGVECGQYWQHRGDMFTDDHITRPGLSTYLGVITAPTLVMDGAAVGDSWGSAGRFLSRGWSEWPGFRGLGGRQDKRARGAGGG